VKVQRVRIVKGIDGARGASGVVVVIDVLRAFTTAAYAFRAGLTEIELVSTVRKHLPLLDFGWAKWADG
jgi:2-phosphosulfolactate phosphatase